MKNRVMLTVMYCLCISLLPVVADDFTLNVHEPGVYEGSLLDYNNRQYEVFYANRDSNSYAFSSISEYQQGVITSMFGLYACGTSWFMANAHTTHQANDSIGAEFGKVVCRADMRLRDSIIMRVKGYSEFAILAMDKSADSTQNKCFEVYIDGERQALQLSSSLSIRRYPITRDEHFIKVYALGTSNSNFYAFSLRVAPPLPTLASLSVNRKLLTNFSPEINDYEYLTATDVSVPVVAATPADSTYVCTITQAASIPGTASVVVSNGIDSVINTYHVHFVLVDSILTLHEPGRYEKYAPAGYDGSLHYLDGREYEVYYINRGDNGLNTSISVVNNDKNNGIATNINQYECIANDGWFFIKVNSTSSSSDSIGAEFGRMVRRANMREGNSFVMRVKGYSEFAMVASDNNRDTTKNRFFEVYIDGQRQARQISTSTSIRRYPITRGEHIIKVHALGLSNNRLYAFSLQVDPGPTLDSLYVNGSPISDFSPNTTDYTYAVPAGDPIPTISAIPTDSTYTVSLSQATAVPGVATVVVTDNTEDAKATKTYTIHIVEAEPVLVLCKGSEYHSPESDSVFVINEDTIIDHTYLHVNTANPPQLDPADYPLLLGERLYTHQAEKRLREAFAQINPHAPDIDSIVWSYIIEESGTAWAQYHMFTACGDTVSDILQIEQQDIFTTESSDFWVALTLFGTSNPYVPAPFLAISAKQPTNISIIHPNDSDWTGVNLQTGANSWTYIDTSYIPLEYWYPQQVSTVDDTDTLSGQTHNLGLHVTADEEIMLFAAQRMLYSYDVTNILPTEMLGFDYYIQDYPPYIKDSKGLATFTILAIEDSTIVEITPKTTTADGHVASETYSVVLNAGQTYYVVSEDQMSLSGTHIAAIDEKRIAVFHGDVFTQVPGGKAARDCLYEQAVPVNLWGRSFVVSRSLQKDANRVRVTASENQTDVFINGVHTVSIDAGETFEFEMCMSVLSLNASSIHPCPYIYTEDAVLVETNRPVEVYLYDVSSSYQNRYLTETVDNYGDPSMVWIAPLEQRVFDTTFGVFGTDKTTRHFINIVCETKDTAFTTLSSTLRSRVPLTFQPLTNSPEYSYARVMLQYNGFENMNSEVFRLTNPFGVNTHVYGHGEDESYATSLGATRPVNSLPCPIEDIQEEKRNGMTDLQSATIKIIMDGHFYIKQNGILYDSLGRRVRYK